VPIRRDGSDRLVRLAFPLRGEDGPLTFDLLFGLQAGLQHPEFSCERAKLSDHVSSPLPTQRLSALERQQLAGHGVGEPDYMPFPG
jgi:hypothetical protein